MDAAKNQAPEERIMGSEVEWAVVPIPRNNQGTLITKSIPRAIMPPEIVFNNPDKQTFLLNGARIYFDTGEHLEYASPEAAGPRNLVIYEKAGEAIVEKTLAVFNETECGKEIKKRGAPMRAFKNNLAKSASSNPADFNPPTASWGSHENYLFSLRRFLNKDYSINTEKLAQLLNPFLVSRQLFTGNGYVTRNENNLHYCISQRSSIIFSSFGGSSTSSRPLIHIGREKHAEKPDYRLHLICADSNIAETALFLKYGTMDIVLTMIDEGFFTDRIVAASNSEFVEAVRKLNWDPSLRAKALFGPDYYSLLDIQKKYLELAHRFFSSGGRLTRDRRETLSHWTKIIDLADGSSRPWEVLHPYLDWAAKLFCIELDMEDKKYSWESRPEETILKGADRRSAFNHLKSVDLQYHENSERGIARIMQRKGILKRMISDGEIKRAVMRPFPDTRAWARAKQLRWIKKEAFKRGERATVSADWTVLSAFFTEKKFEIHFKNTDPRDSNPRLPSI